MNAFNLKTVYKIIKVGATASTIFFLIQRSIFNMIGFLMKLVSLIVILTKLRILSEFIKRLGKRLIFPIL